MHAGLIYRYIYILRKSERYWLCWKWEKTLSMTIPCNMYNTYECVVYIDGKMCLLLFFFSASTTATVDSHRQPQSIECIQIYIHPRIFYFVWSKVYFTHTLFRFKADTELILTWNSYVFYTWASTAALHSSTMTCWNTSPGMGPLWSIE